MLTFPQCERVGTSFASIQPYPTCGLMCEQAQVTCGMKSLDCKGPLYNRGPCSLYIPDGYFLLPPELGPYYFIFIVYYILFAFWVVFCMVWSFCSATPRCNHQSKLIATLLLLQGLVLIFTASFWQQCELNGGLCDVTFGMAVSHLQLLLESGLMLLLLALSHGWGVNTPHLRSSEWQYIHGITAAFYTVTVIVITFRSQPCSFKWTAVIVLLYVLLFYQLLRNAWQRLKRLHSHVQMLAPGMSMLATAPLRAKYANYVRFVFGVLLLLSIEALARSLYTVSYCSATPSGSFSRGIQTVWLLVCYEVVSMTVLATLAMSFSPREVSPFYYMVPADEDSLQQDTATGTGSRSPLIVQVQSSSNHHVEEDPSHEQQQHLNVELELPNRNHIMNHPRQLLAVLYRPHDLTVTTTPRDIEIALCRWPNPNHTVH
mmetsp:Transcript_14148/g.19312  ORF Transcript_14148/g.19312 Transcript_14148/m.19312 type:complete len:430 (-) Transcript_14148:65-1354(-)